MDMNFQEYSITFFQTYTIRYLPILKSKKENFSGKPIEISNKLNWP